MAAPRGPTRDPSPRVPCPSSPPLWEMSLSRPRRLAPADGLPFMLSSQRAHKEPFSRLPPASRLQELMETFVQPGITSTHIG